YKQSSAINTHMMRLAEVYLNYADAALGNESSTTDATALEYFNKVRARAGLDPVEKISYEKLRHEYRLETAFEGLYWYFLVRRAYVDQAGVVGYLNSQDRNRTYKYDTDKAAYVQSENAGTGVNTADAGRLLLKYPDTETTKNPALNNTPGAYSFGEREVDEATLFD
ncbi:MAG: RagB/SusD family nutrient uptake outer membrane protein, partial [Bacteroidales bacterium]|nr:RagB/SusD family nutrient uptake outer membrane protein [Bacteroidales bacterium]